MKPDIKQRWIAALRSGEYCSISIYKASKLAGLNDNESYTFNQLADVIEAHL